MRKVHCTAKGRIGVGKRVLVRGHRAEMAGPELANGTSAKLPSWDRSRFYKDGQSLVVELDEGLGSRDLHAIANGPIMDPSEIFLPAGKLSMDETRARERAQILEGDPLP